MIRVVGLGQEYPQEYLVLRPVKEHSEVNAQIVHGISILKTHSQIVHCHIITVKQILAPGLSQSKEISSDLCCFYGGGISHNENIMHSFQKFIVVSIPTTLPL